MAQIGKVEGQIEIKSHADKFFDVWARKPHLISNMCPANFPKIELREGNWGKVNCVNTWHYVADGKHEFIKTRIAEIDENNRSVTYDNVDGHIMKNYYKSLTTKIQITPKGANCIVKWSFDYEKMNEDAPEADKYVYFLLKSAKEIDARLNGV